MRTLRCVNLISCRRQFRFLNVATKSLGGVKMKIFETNQILFSRLTIEMQDSPYRIISVSGLGKIILLKKHFQGLKNRFSKNVQTDNKDGQHSGKT